MIGRFDPKTGKIVWTEERPEEEPNPRDLTLSRRDPGAFVARQENPTINREVWHRVNKDGEALISGRAEALEYQTAIERHYDKGLTANKIRYDGL